MQSATCGRDRAGRRPPSWSEPVGRFDRLAVLGLLVLALAGVWGCAASSGAGDGSGRAGSVGTTTGQQGGGQDSGGQNSDGQNSEGQNAEPHDRGAGTRDPDQADGRANYSYEIDAPATLVKLIRDNTLLGRWQYRDDYDISQRALFVRRAPDEVRQVLSTEGYFQPEVDIEESLFKVTMKVWTGPRSTINQAKLQFSGEIDDSQYAARRATLERAWPLPEGSFFTQTLWNNAKRDIVNSLRNDGFPRAKIADSRAAVDLEKTAVSLNVRVDSGPLMRIGKVSFEGLERYDSAVLTPLQPFQTGDVYTLRELQEFQTRLRDTLWFRTVTVLPDLGSLDDNPDQRDIDVRVVVVENQSRRLTLGVGYSTDRGIRGQIGWTDRNWLSRAWQLDSKLIIDRLAYTGNVGVRTPTEAEGHYWSTGLNLERTDIQNTINQMGNLYFGRGRQLGEIEYFASLTYQLDREWILNDDGSRTYYNRHALVPGYSWNVRRIDSRLYPTRGYTFNAQVSGAVENLLSTTSFLRGYVRTLRFFRMPADTPFEGGVLMLVAEGGAVFSDSRDGVPSQNLFRAGGAQSVRGYSYQSIGIRRGASIIGGRYLAMGSVEYQHPIWPSVAGAVFYDRGGVSDNWRDMTTVAGYGVGVRLRTPVGPVNFDVAYGQADRRVRAHLSIGYTF